MVRTDDLPTLRLVTLRRLVRGMQPPVVLSQQVSVADVEEALRASSPDGVAVLVDGASVLQGTLRLGELASADRSEHAERVMTRTTPILDAENDIEAARAAMARNAIDRVLVIGSNGELLGVLTDRDLAAAAGKRPRNVA